MKLVDGEYCTEVQHRCLRSWHSKWTRKTVCTEFASPGQCIGEREHKRYCIDTYEWPNIAGERPDVMNDFYQAQVKCAAAGKRLCTETEWTLACEGPEMKPFPYGYVRDALACNGDHMWDNPDLSKVERYDRVEIARLWQGVRSGSQPRCVSDYGVADMPGNVDEVSFNEERTSASTGNYDNAITGGNWYLGVRNQCRPKVYTHDDGCSYYFLGFRCCAEADGKPSEPLAPRQARRKWGWDPRRAGDRYDVPQARRLDPPVRHVVPVQAPGGARHGPVEASAPSDACTQDRLTSAESRSVRASASGGCRRRGEWGGASGREAQPRASQASQAP